MDKIVEIFKKGDAHLNFDKLFETQKVLDTRIEKEHPRLDGEDRLAKKILALQVELGELANEWRGFKFWSNNQKPRLSLYTTQGATEENASYFQCSDEKCDERFDKCDSQLKDLFGPNFEECPICKEGNLVAFRLKNPLLEEYVDCLHFILSIGLENYKYGSSDDYVQLPIGWIRDHTPIKYENVIKQFNYLFNTIGYLMDCTSDCEMGTNSEIEDQYENVYRIFIGLGQMLGFTQEQIEEAYYQKNEVNHERQNTGY